MTRDIGTDNQAASESERGYRIVLFVELMFDDGPVRFHSDLGEIVWGGNTYTGTGRLGSISAVEEESELARSPITMTLSGLPTDLLSVLLNQHYQGRKATVYLGYRDSATGQLVDDPFILYRGRMDKPAVDVGDTFAIQLSVESRFAAWDRPNSLRYNNATQQSLYPGDRGLESAEQSVDRQIAWGTKLQ